MTIVSNNMNSVAFPFNGIFLFNSFVESNAQIKAIEFFTNNLAISKINLYVIHFYNFTVNFKIYLIIYLNSFFILHHQTVIRLSLVHHILNL